MMQKFSGVCQRKYGRKEVTVRDALDLAGRTGDDPTALEKDYDDPDALRKAIVVYLKGEPETVIAKETSASVDVATEEPRLQRYSVQYKDWGGGLKARCSWKEIKDRLLAQNGLYLALAEGMNEKGVLFGVDSENNPLFADGGEEPIMTGMDYANTRNRVLYEFQGDSMKQEDGKPVKTGYEMFPYRGEYDKSDEIQMFEATTGKPFVKSPNGAEWCSSWLESGDNPGSKENPSLPRYAYFNPSDGYVNVDLDDPQRYRPRRGVRRLLRVKKAS